MTQDRVIAQVNLRLQHCLEQRDRPGILALTTWLVHRHGHPLLQQLLSQPEWASHRLWWGEQVSHPNPDLQPQSALQPQPRPERTPMAKDHQDEDKVEHKTMMAAQGMSDPWETAPAPQQHPELEDGLRPGGRSAHPANPTASSDQDRDHVKLTPAQVTKQRLKMCKPAKPANPLPIQKQDGTVPTVTQAVTRKESQKNPPNRKSRSLHLRDWLPSSRLPHQDAA